MWLTFSIFNTFVISSIHKRYRVHCHCAVIASIVDKYSSRLFDSCKRQKNFWWLAVDISTILIQPFLHLIIHSFVIAVTTDWKLLFNNDHHLLNKFPNIHKFIIKLTEIIPLLEYLNISHKY